MKNICILGPTASGKTALAIKLAKKYNSTIINMDTRQFWKNLKIITASPNSEEINQANHKLYNILDNNEKPNLGWWAQEYQKIPGHKIIVGGNFFYALNLIRGIPIYKELLYTDTLENMKYYLESKNIYLNDPYHIQRNYSFYKNYNCTFKNYPHKIQEDLDIILMNINKDYLYKKIIIRAKIMIPYALEEINSQEFQENFTSVIGYKELYNYKNNIINYNQLEEELIHKTHKYAKKQIKDIYKYFISQIKK